MSASIVYVEEQKCWTFRDEDSLRGLLKLQDTCLARPKSNSEAKCNKRLAAEKKECVNIVTGEFLKTGFPSRLAESFLWSLADYSICGVKQHGFVIQDGHGIEAHTQQSLLFGKWHLLLWHAYLSAHGVLDTSSYGAPPPLYDVERWRGSVSKVVADTPAVSEVVADTPAVFPLRRANTDIGALTGVATWVRRILPRSRAPKRDRPPFPRRDADLPVQQCNAAIEENAEAQRTETKDASLGETEEGLNTCNPPIQPIAESMQGPDNSLTPRTPTKIRPQRRHTIAGFEDECLDDEDLDGSPLSTASSVLTDIFTPSGGVPIQTPATSASNRSYSTAPRGRQAAVEPSSPLAGKSRTRLGGIGECSPSPAPRASITSTADLSEGQAVAGGDALKAAPGIQTAVDNSAVDKIVIYASDDHGWNEAFEALKSDFPDDIHPNPEPIIAGTRKDAASRYGLVGDESDHFAKMGTTDKVALSNIFDKLLTLGTVDQTGGYVYGFSRTSAKGYIKIGKEESPRQRAAYWSTHYECECTLVFRAYMPCAAKAMESLIHSHLNTYRYRDRSCPETRRHDANQRTAVAGTHVEWFKITIKDVIPVVRLWQRFSARMPVAHCSLRTYWRHEVHHAKLLCKDFSGLTVAMTKALDKQENWDKNDLLAEMKLTLRIKTRGDCSSVEILSLHNAGERTLISLPISLPSEDCSSGKAIQDSTSSAKTSTAAG